MDSHQEIRSFSRDAWMNTERRSNTTLVGGCCRISTIFTDCMANVRFHFSDDRPFEPGIMSTLDSLFCCWLPVPERRMLVESMRCKRCKHMIVRRRGHFLENYNCCYKSDSKLYIVWDLFWFKIYGQIGKVANLVVTPYIIQLEFNLLLYIRLNVGESSIIFGRDFE